MFVSALMEDGQLIDLGNRMQLSSAHPNSHKRLQKVKSEASFLWTDMSLNLYDTFKTIFIPFLCLKCNVVSVPSLIVRTF